MISFDALDGNRELKESLRYALSHRFPQTVLLTGEDEASLAMLTNIVAAGILCESEGERPCGKCRSCRKFERDADLSDEPNQSVHPDLTVVEAILGSEEAKVKFIRELKKKTFFVPTDGARRVTVFRHAHTLTPGSQNALLKVFEEPPSFSFFILESTQPDSLLQTVRSRCTKFSLEPPHSVPDEEIITLVSPYLQAIADRQEARMMLTAMALDIKEKEKKKKSDGNSETDESSEDEEEKKAENQGPRRRHLLRVMRVLREALRDAILKARGLSVAPLQPALQAQTDALARAVPADRLLNVYYFIVTMTERITRSAGSAAVTLALTSDVYRLCFL